MPYGEGYTERELERMQREYAKTDDNATYVVTTDRGTKVTVTGINSARAVAGKTGTYRKTKG